MNPSSQPYQPGELPPVPPAFPGDAAAASLTAEQVQALRNRNYLRADSYTRADSYGRQDSGLSFYEYQIGDGDESPGSLSTATGYLAQLLQTSPQRRSSPTPSPPLSLDALDLDGGEENDLDLECVVCCELYDTSVHAPMVLPCSGAHEICRTCVAALRKADGTIQCPKCREDATGAVNPNRGLIAALRLSRRS